MGEERFGNYSSCCRLCLSDKFNCLKPIFEDEAESRTLVQRIVHFLGVEVTPNDKVSTMICNQCRSKVNDWDTFKAECSTNQTKLQQWLSSWDASSRDNNIGDMTIHVKDEPVDREDSQDIPQLEENTEDQVTTIKLESNDEDVEEFYEQPPQLTPHLQDSRSQEFDDQPGLSSMGKEKNKQRKHRTAVTLKQKISIIRMNEAGVSKEDISKKYKISTSTVAKIVKKKDTVLRHMNELPRTMKNRSRIDEGENAILEKILVDWLAQKRSLGIAVQGPMIREKAMEIYEELQKKTNDKNEPAEIGKKHHTFKASEGWLDRFKKRYGIGEIAMKCY